MSDVVFTHSRYGARIYQGNLSWFGEIRQGTDVVAETVWVNRELADVKFRGEPSPELQAWVKDGLVFDA